MTLQPPLLDVQDFSLEFRTRSGTVQALQHVNLRVGKGEIVGLVGESGSGKSVLSYAMLGISDAAAKVTGGSAMFGGIDLLKADEATLLELRGREISMIFQSPRTALNPIRPVGQQIEDVLRRHAVATRGRTGVAPKDLLALRVQRGDRGGDLHPQGRVLDAAAEDGEQNDDQRRRHARPQGHPCAVIPWQ